METLQLRDIQYYPIGGYNGLRCDISFTDRDGQLYQYKGKYIVGIQYEGIEDIPYLVKIRLGRQSYDIIFLSPDKIKPYLRPMSDLIKPLPDGTIPIIQMAKIVHDDAKGYDPNNWFEWDKVRVETEDKSSRFCRCGKYLTDKVHIRSNKKKTS